MRLRQGGYSPVFAAPPPAWTGAAVATTKKMLVQPCDGRNVINLAGYRAQRGSDGPWERVFSVIWPHTSLVLLWHRLGVRAKPVKSKQAR